MTDDWREYIPDFHYKQEDEYYYFPDDAELTFAEEKLVPVEASKKHRKSLHFQISRLFHRIVLTEGTLGYRIARFIYRTLKKRKLAGRLCYFYERQVKRLLYDCQECGDCALFDLAYLCPMSKCAKFQRNGPCGGSKNGMCEADDTKRCVWTLVYDRFSSTNNLDYLRREYIPPVDCSLSKTSSWANFYLGRDHTSKKIASSEGEK